MTIPTWHLEYAKVVLREWYERAEEFILNSKQGTKLQQYWMTPYYKRKALHCKTAGLVWHDRYKMLLDCQRSYGNFEEDEE